MSMPINNLNQGGYAPPGFGAGYPSAPPPVDSQPGFVQSAYGFQPPQQPGSGYQPPGYPPNGPQTGYAPPGQPSGYPPNGPQTGYAPPGQPSGYPPNGPQTGYAPPGQPSGYSQPGYQPPPGQYPPAPAGYQPVPQDPMSGAKYGGYAPHPAAPIVTQPGAVHPQGDWMNMPAGIPNCPRGLEYLTTVDQLLVKQKVELLEAFTGFETNNKFTVKNSLGQKVFYAVEDTDCCTRNMCGKMRPFDMKILDNYKSEVMHLYRPLACDSCCFPCCLQSLEVSAPPGNVIGSIEQEWSICTPQYAIKNHHGDVVLRIEGPFCTFSLCGDVEFKVVSLAGEQVGKISKQWSGLAREMFTDADFFGINFPMDLDVRMKAVLLGATFLIDAMFFEKSGNRETDGPGML